MNKDDYIEVRNTNHIDINLFYKYYCNNTQNKQPIPFELFSQTFTMFIRMNSEQVFKYLDSVFDINMLYDKTGNLIRVL